MKTVLQLSVIVGSAALLAGCGGSTSRLTLNAYTVRENEEPGYTATGAMDYRTVQALEAGTGATPSEDASLRVDGFEEAAVENPGTQQSGLSFVYEFATVAGARRQQASELAEDTRGAVRFAVPAIPGADGIAYPAKPGGGGGNVLFREGRCVLVVGDSDTSGDYRAPAIAGAIAIWKRTRSRPGPCSAQPPHA